jgi:formylglycine-generating enzyme required for sulfatase activity
MVNVPGGTFAMGSDAGDPDERPVHSVAVATFCLDKTEVTVGAYAECVSAGACLPTGRGETCNVAARGRDAHPVNCVDWNQARAYCARRGARLPTEEEWEFAARGSEGRTYPWGNTEPLDQVCWRSGGTCPVGTHPAGATPLGIHDLAGNVREWLESPYMTSYLQPRPDQPGHRVGRGSSYLIHSASLLRATKRYGGNPSRQHGGSGFRCAR